MCLFESNSGSCCFLPVMDWIVFPPNLCVGVLTPKVTIFEGKAFKNVIKVK